jgi:hypothetical protein
MEYRVPLNPEALQAAMQDGTDALVGMAVPGRTETLADADLRRDDSQAAR